MKELIVDARASAILYRLLRGITDESGVFLLPGNVCPVVPLTFVAAERRFEFIDLDPESLQMDLGKMARRVDQPGAIPVAGILWVRTYGASRGSDEGIARLRGISPKALIIDDRCLCEPDIEGITEPTAADVVLYSTGRAKPVDLGFGGYALVAKGTEIPAATRPYRPDDLREITEWYTTCIVEDRPLLADGDPSGEARLRSLEWIESGLPEMDRDRLIEEIRRVADDRRSRTAAVNRVYAEAFPSEIQLAPEFQNWRFNLRIPGSAELVRKIFAAGYWASRHYYPTARLFGDFNRPVVEALHRDIVNLPNDMSVNVEAAKDIAEIVLQHLDEHGDVESSS